MEQQESIAGIKIAIAANRLKQYKVAEALDCSEQLLSLYLSERRKPPPGFERQAMEAIEFLAGEERDKQERLKEWKKRPQPAA